jgi:two-component system alkaline phosphatase synthesis response regulator PhoP
MKDGRHIILCIDDDPDFLESIQTIVESEGYVIETASSAEEGVRKYRQCKPDFVLVDLMMEEVDAGTSFVKDVRALGATPPIYMLSSVGDGLSMATDYSQLGLAGVLQKPIRPEVLVSTLRARLAQGS